MARLRVVGAIRDFIEELCSDNEIDLDSMSAKDFADLILIELRKHDNE